MTTKKDMSKKKRGSHESLICLQDRIMVARWLDNSVVTVASTGHGVFPLSNVQRFSQAEKKIVMVPRPLVVGEYNKHMGGTDRMDENIAMYCTGVRGKKWWWPLFTWLLDAAIHNAWIIARSTGSDLPQLEFWRLIAQTYVMRYKAPPKGTGHPATAAQSSTGSRVSDELRYDGIGHLVYPTENNKRAGHACCSVGRTECRKCDVGLCVSCFGPFHIR